MEFITGTVFGIVFGILLAGAVYCVSKLRQENRARLTEWADAERGRFRERRIRGAHPIPPEAPPSCSVPPPPPVGKKQEPRG